MTEHKIIFGHSRSPNQIKLCDASKGIITEDEIGNTSSFEQLRNIFSDPYRMDKKVDVKKLQFGSKNFSSEAKRKDLFGVELNYKRNVGTASEAIRTCAPKMLKEHQDCYFENVRSQNTY